MIWEQHQNKNRYTLVAFQEFFNESLKSLGALTIVDRAMKIVVGSSRFNVIDATEKVIEIGWSFLARAYWGGKYNKEVKKLMINHALSSCENVVFYVHPQNFRSQRALEKLGTRKMNFERESWVLPEEKGITFSITTKL